MVPAYTTPLNISRSLNVIELELLDGPREDVAGEES